MKKYKSAYLKPYIRVAKKKDFNECNASDFSVFLDMLYYEDRKAYVLVQRGCKEVIEMRGSREELQRSLVAIRHKKHIKKAYNQWSNGIKNTCQRT